MKVLRRVDWLPGGGVRIEEGEEVLVLSPEDARAAGWWDVVAPFKPGREPVQSESRPLTVVEIDHENRSVTLR